MTWTEPQQCAICDNTDRRELRWGLVKWLVAPPGMRYQHIERCIDEEACRARFIDQTGEPWPLAERKVPA